MNNRLRWENGEKGPTQEMHSLRSTLLAATLALTAPSETQPQPGFAGRGLGIINLRRRFLKQ